MLVTRVRLPACAFLLIRFGCVLDSLGAVLNRIGCVLCSVFDTAESWVGFLCGLVAWAQAELWGQAVYGPRRNIARWIPIEKPVGNAKGF